MNIQTVGAKVSAMYSHNGNAVPNQLTIRTNEGVFFQSYDSIIAFQGHDGKVLLDEKYWNYSVTTNRYRNMFLGENKAETQRKIDSGVYKLVNLNP